MRRTAGGILVDLAFCLDAAVAADNTLDRRLYSMAEFFQKITRVILLRALKGLNQL